MGRHTKLGAQYACPFQRAGKLGSELYYRPRNQWPTVTIVKLGAQFACSLKWAGILGSELYYRYRIECSTVAIGKRGGQFGRSLKWAGILGSELYYRYCRPLVSRTLLVSVISLGFLAIVARPAVPLASRRRLSTATPVGVR